MTDPKRWLDEPPFAGTLAEQLILAGKRLDLPPDGVERSFAEFSARLAAGTVAVATTVEAATSAAGAGSGGATAAGLSTAALVKTFVVGAVFGVGVSSAVPVARHFTRPAPLAAVKVSAPVPAGSAVLPRNELPPAPREIASPATASVVPARPATLSGSRTSSAPASSPSNSADTNRLKLEALELARAKNQLESGDPQGALRVLQESRARFVNGALVEERDALVVEALSKQGDRVRARDAARRFLDRFPNSPLVERVKRWRDGE